MGLRELFDAAVAAGFEFVGIDLASACSSFPDDTMHAAIAAALKTRGLACSDVGILFIGVPWTDDHARQLAALAHELKAPTCLATFAGPVTDESIGQLRRSAALLHDAGARIALEYMPVGHLKSVTDASIICAEIGWDRCGLLLDSYHVCRAGSVRQQLSRLSAEQISLIQLADGEVPLRDPPGVDARRYRLPAGYGDLAIPEFVSRLHTLGWAAGTISPEVLAEDLITVSPRLGAALLHASARLASEVVTAQTPSAAARFPENAATARGDASGMEMPRLVSDLFAAYNAQDPTRVEELYAAGASHEDVTLGNLKHGPTAIGAGLAYFLSGFPDAHWKLRGHVDGSSSSAGWYRLTGTLRADFGPISACGQQLNLRGAMVFTHVGGRITSTCDYWDLQTFQRQMSSSGLAV